MASVKRKNNRAAERESEREHRHWEGKCWKEGETRNSRQKVASPFSSKTRVERNEMMEMEWNVSVTQTKRHTFFHMCACLCVWVSAAAALAALVVVFLCRVCFVRQNRRQNYTFSFSCCFTSAAAAAALCKRERTMRMNEQIINNLRDKIEENATFVYFIWQFESVNNGNSIFMNI